MPDTALIDIETVPIKDIDAYLGDIRVPKNYKKPASIEKYKEDNRQAAREDAALDADLCRVVALGVGLDADTIRVGFAEDEDEEREMLRKFWNFCRTPFGPRPLTGFNILDFDVPVLLRRSLFLGVAPVQYSVDRYRHDPINDLMFDELSLKGKLTYRTVDFYCRRFGITGVPDEYSGKDVPILFMAKKYDAIKNHCFADVKKEILLAYEIGAMDDRRLRAPQPTSTPVSDNDQAF